MEARLGFKMVLSVHMNPCIDFVCEFQMLNCFILLSIWCLNFERVKRNIFGQKGKVYDIFCTHISFLDFVFSKGNFSKPNGSCCWIGNNTDGFWKSPVSIYYKNLFFKRDFWLDARTLVDTSLKRNIG